MMDKRRAKMDSLSDLSDEMSKVIGDDFAKGMGKMKKVTVASDSEEGLKEGLNKAQDIMKKKLGEQPSSDSVVGERSYDAEPMEDMEEEMEDEMMDEESPEAMRKKIMELQKKLADLE